MMIFLGLALLFLIILAVTLLAVWYGSWAYKRGYHVGWQDRYERRPNRYIKVKSVKPVQPK